MRISDWSSDVCSSDLLQTSSTPKNPLHTRAYVYHCQSECKRPMLTDNRQSGTSSATGAEGGGLDGGDLIQGVFCEANRSEEHTSELQSLMRSSYAVFCLKKKNR